MKTLIAYATKYGTTETCAKLLAEAMSDPVDLINLSKGESAEPAQYEAVVVGGPIYAGQLRKEVRAFMRKHKRNLLEVRFGCFICQASPQFESHNDFDANFDRDLLEHASARSSFGGQLHEEKMTFFDRLILGAIAKRGGAKPPHINKEKIRSFALAMEVT
ncbi:flavodoxin domain-containing protein, partial [Ruminococcaceae bacterium OttesenSCG-928-I18]|nr:flavodoxin domain-containing protein [Ruminococcaceae bacterium OttesenSCG-928-I18]